MNSVFAYQRYKGEGVDDVWTEVSPRAAPNSLDSKCRYGSASAENFKVTCSRYLARVARQSIPKVLSAQRDLSQHA